MYWKHWLYFVPRMKLVIIALLLIFSVDFIHPYEIGTKFRGLGIITFFYSHCVWFL